MRNVLWHNNPQHGILLESLPNWIQVLRFCRKRMSATRRRMSMPGLRQQNSDFVCVLNRSLSHNNRSSRRSDICYMLRKDTPLSTSTTPSPSLATSALPAAALAAAAADARPAAESAAAITAAAAAAFPAATWSTAHRVLGDAEPNQHHSAQHYTVQCRLDDVDVRLLLPLE